MSVLELVSIQHKWLLCYSDYYYQNIMQSVELKHICRCGCIHNLFNYYEQYIYTSNMGETYQKIMSNSTITKKEYQELLGHIISHFEYKNYKEVINDNYREIYADCKYRFTEYEHQEYDEYGPIDEGEECIYDCYNGYNILTPRPKIIVLITFIMNIITSMSGIAHFNYENTENSNEYLSKIEEICENNRIYHPSVFNRDEYSSKKHITFPQFKGFEHYFKILNSQKN